MKRRGLHRIAVVRALMCASLACACLPGASLGDVGEPASDEDGGVDRLDGSGEDVDEALEDGEEWEGVEEVIITGTHDERLLGDAPTLVEVINQEQIKRSGARHLADVLEDLPGVQVDQSFRGAEVRLQGLDPEHVLILIDGERITGRVDGVVDLSRYAVGDIERVEIIKGASSALYGSDALGGVINIITRRARQALSADARVNTRHFCSSATPDTLASERDPNVVRRCEDVGFGLETLGSVGARGDDWGARLSGGYQQRDAYDLDAQDANTTGSQARGFQIGVKGDGEPTSTVRLEASGEFWQRRQEGVDVSTTGALSDRRNLTRGGRGSLSASFDMGRGGRLGTLLGYSLYDDQYQRDARSEQAVDEQDLTTEHLTELRVTREALILDRHLASSGAQVFYHRLSSDRLRPSDGGGETPARDRFQGALYHQFELSLLDDDSLWLVPGARLDLDTGFGVQLSPKLAVRHDPVESLSLRSSYGMGFRAPSFQEQWLRFENPGVGYVVEGDPGLLPERSHNVNLSGVYEPVSWLQFSAQFFFNQIENLIQFSLDEAAPELSVGAFRYDNIGEARTMGVESVAQLRLFPVLFEVSHTFTDARDLGLDLPLQGRSAHRLTARASFQQSLGSADWSLRLDSRLRFISGAVYHETQDDRTVARTAPAYVTMDAHMSAMLGGHIEIFVGVDNIMDRGAILGSPLSPRTFTSGLAGTFQE